MAVLMRLGNRRCDSRCVNAKGTVCRCICGGLNHGARKIAEDTKEEEKENVLPAEV